MFANRMWHFINKTDKALWLKDIPDWIPLPKCKRVGVSQWPKSLPDYPPMYDPGVLSRVPEIMRPEVPMLSCGRYGSLHKDESQANPSDSAIVAMIQSAKEIVRMSLQDFGPLCLPGVPGPTSIPGGQWPAEYFKALGLGIYWRDLDVEVVLSNPLSVPGKLSPTVACYGNGWTAVDVASELIKSIRDNLKAEGEDVMDDRLEAMVVKNLRITMLRSCENEDKWPDGEGLGNHAKFFIVDKRAFYIGSQNLYIANLAEWGVVVDDLEETAKVIDQYWDPMWRNSFRKEEWESQRASVMAGLDIDRNGEDISKASKETKLLAAEAMRGGMKCHNGQPDTDELYRMQPWLKHQDDQLFEAEIEHKDVAQGCNNNNCSCSVC